MNVVIATKGGITRSEGESWGRDGSLAYLRSAVEKSLRNLRVDADRPLPVAPAGSLAWSTAR